MKKGENIKYLIIGAGNLLLSDEGMGIHIVNKLKEQESFKDTEFVDIGTSTLDIGSFLSDELQKIVIVDCIKTAEYKEGTVFKLTLDDLRARQLNKFSLHQMELVDSLKLLSIANNLPPVMIIGVVPHNISTFSMELSPEIETVFPAIVEKIAKVIEDFFKS
jgi:hydrogenase maturation protease